MASPKDSLSPESSAALAAMGSAPRRGEPATASHHPPTHEGQPDAPAAAPESPRHRRVVRRSHLQQVPEPTAAACVRELEALTRDFEVMKRIVALGRHTPVSQAQGHRQKIMLLRSARRLAKRSRTLSGGAALADPQLVDLAKRADALVTRIGALSLRGLRTKALAPRPIIAPRALRPPTPRLTGALLPPRRLPPATFGPAHADYYEDPTNSK